MSAFHYNTCPCVIKPHVFVFVCHYNASVRIHMWLVRVGSWLRVIVTRCFAYVCIRNARTYIHICVSIWYVRSCLSYIRRVFVFVCWVDSIYSMFRFSKKPITPYNLDNYPLLFRNNCVFMHGQLYRWLELVFWTVYIGICIMGRLISIPYLSLVH